MCPHCKKECYRAPDSCFKLAKNKEKRPSGWKIWLGRCGTVSKVELSKSVIDKLLTHTSNFSPTLDIATLTLPNIINVTANHTPQQHVLPTKATGIVDSGATDIYFSIDAPVVNIDRATPKVTVGTSTGQTQKLAVAGNLALPHIPLGFPIKGHLMTGLLHTLIVVGPLCDADCTVTFTRKAANVPYKQVTSVLTGWSEATGTRIWRIDLQLEDSNLPSMPNNAKQATLVAYSAYDLPSFAALIRYFHTAAG